MNLIINTITAWYEPPRARHQIALALSKSHNIIFVARNELGMKRLKIENIEGGITLITPFYPLDYRFRYRIPMINENYQNWLYSELQKLYRGLPVINFDFTAHKLNKYFKNVIYYCNDECIGNSKYPNWIVDHYHIYCENHVIRNALFNVTTSAYLTNKLKAINAKTHEIWLGAAQIDLPSDYNGISSEVRKTIKLGLMGVINCKQISCELINNLMEDPNFELIIIGPVEKKFCDRINPNERIKYTGILKGNQLVYEMMKLDVGLALYNVDQVNAGATPNKLWQYLAVGKPVIISQLPNLQASIFPKDSVYIYNNCKALNELIYTAHNNNTADLAMQRINFSRQNTWDIRAKDFELLMNQYLS